MRTIIVEDELMAQKALKRLCETNSRIALKEIFGNGKEALDYLRKNTIDLVFLDIEMPVMTGLELLENLNYVPQIIIVTSKKEYAYEAFEYDVADFLTKPANAKRFEKSVERAFAKFDLLNEVANLSATNEVYIKDDGKLIRLTFDQIAYFENVGDYIKVVTAERAFVIYGTIKGLDEKLNHPRFLKVHRSFIVNLDKIKDIKDNSLIIHKKVIPISRAHKAILINSINIL